MSNPTGVRMFGEPPGPGECKLRIRSNGTTEGTSIVTVDDQGVERSLLGAEAVSWKLEVGLEPARACVRVIESEVELEAEKVAVEPGKEDP